MCFIRLFVISYVSTFFFSQFSFLIGPKRKTVSVKKTVIVVCQQLKCY